MKTYVVCVSDSAGADRRTPVIVDEETGLGRVSQMAIDDFVAFFGDAIQFPIFVDIHPAQQFANVSWLHPRASTGRPDATSKPD
jgi:hypothetical protein